MACSSQKVPIASRDPWGANMNGPWHNRDRPWPTVTNTYLESFFLTYRKNSVTDRDTAWHPPKWPFHLGWSKYWCFLQTPIWHPTSFQQFWVQFTPSGNSTWSLAMSELEKVMMEAGKFRYKSQTWVVVFTYAYVVCGDDFLLLTCSLYITPSYGSGGYSCHWSRETKGRFST